MYACKYDASMYASMEVFAFKVCMHLICVIVCMHVSMHSCKYVNLAFKVQVVGLDYRWLSKRALKRSVALS